MVILGPETGVLEGHYLYCLLLFPFCSPLVVKFFLKMSDGLSCAVQNQREAVLFPLEPEF